jgi:AcrR family transcriptional regulator
VAERSRERLLEAAARVYARFGYAGTTTRRVAEEAGLNEVTLFRHFGTKERLLAEAVLVHTGEVPAALLPGEPADPPAELARWCERHLAHVRSARGVLRHCLTEPERLPEVDAAGQVGIEQAADELRAYVEALRAGGWVAPGAETETAVTMLLSALLLDALGREDFPRVFLLAEADAGRRYALGFLAALGARGPVGEAA